MFYSLKLYNEFLRFKNISINNKSKLLIYYLYTKYNTIINNI